jgi:DNA polymerase
MTNCFAIDFETHWNKGSYSVADLGNWAYTQHPRFKALTVATHDGREGHASTPEAFDWARVHRAVLIAHNAGFDRAVFDRLQELGIVPAGIQPAAWLDSAAACVYHGLPRDLAGASREALGEVVDKSVRDDLGQGGLFAQGQTLLDYATRDAHLAGRLFALLAPTWPDTEMRLAEITDDMGRRGLRLDQEGLAAATVKLAEDLEDLRAAIPWDPPTSVQQLKAWCTLKGYTPPRSTAKNADPEDLGDVNEPEVGVMVRHMQAFRRVNRTLSVLQAMKERLGPDGRMRYQLKYFGANQTGRWSGGGGLNVQNFNRSDAEGVDLRGLIIPEPGHVFIIADYAQIEARVLLWLARETAMLEWLQGGMDLYEAAARRMLNYTDPRPLKQVDPGLRQLAKGMTLGLGFGMGAGKFVTAAKSLAGVELTFDKAQDSVRRFRNANRRVVDLWDRLHDALLNRAGQNVYRLPLPSGRVIRYWNPAASDETLMASDVKGGDARMLHRGLLAENMVQATARDILAGAWLRCVDAGLVPVLSCHDELVFEVPRADADAARGEIERLMLTPPEWEYVDLLPLAVEIQVAERYGK